MASLVSLACDAALGGQLFHGQADILSCRLFKKAATAVHDPGLS